MTTPKYLSVIEQQLDDGTWVPVTNAPVAFSREAAATSYDGPTGGITDGMMPTARTGITKPDADMGEIYPDAAVMSGGWRVPESQWHRFFWDFREDPKPLQQSEGLPTKARRGGIKYPTTEHSSLDPELARGLTSTYSNLDLNTNITVQEVTLEVPVPHDKLAYALGAVDATLAGRRAFGITIPESSRSVTTVGNEIVIRWEEHA